MTVSDTGAQIRVDSKCRSAWVQEFNSAVVPDDMCSWYQQKSKTLMIDASASRLIELFGAYSVSEELQSRCMELHGACKGCMAHAWSCMVHA